MNILKNEKVLDFIKNKKKELRMVFVSLVDAFEQIFPNTPLKLDVIGALIWDVIKYESRIINVYILHDFGLENWGNYGGNNLVSVRIVDTIIEMLEVDLGDIRFKKING